jgi:ssDNA-binding Zn-finger/Zn-ribbon topoisomerase 1
MLSVVILPENYVYEICPDCGYEYLHAEHKCPKCGCTEKGTTKSKKRMKKEEKSD